MSEAKHTPGPWQFVEREVEEDGSVYPRHIVGGARELQICTLESSFAAQRAVKEPDGLYGSDVMMEAEGDARSKRANARLITAAPKMLAALYRCVEVIEFAYMNAPKQPKELDEARAAIAEATGTTS